MTIDLAFVQKSGGSWDIDFENGDLKLTDGLDTAVYMSIFCKRRAIEDQVSNPLFRGGHFTNEFSQIEGYEIGSLFWLYTEQVKNTAANSLLLEQTVREGLNWMIEDDIIRDAEVSTRRTGSKIQLDIRLISASQERSVNYSLFVNTI